MFYNSTRNSGVKVSSAEAITQGISVEGGLFVPESIPQLTFDELKAIGDMKYADRAAYVFSKFLTDFTEAEIHYCTDNAYSTKNFETESIAEIAHLFDGTYMLELWHGPTCAFKDMALQILPYFLTTSAKKINLDKKIVILVATSGDTGKAALEGFKDVEGTSILVFYPEDGVSPMQKRQMKTQEGDNVGVCAIKGNFDDCQNGVKAIFTDNDVKAALDSKGMIFSSANSINWGRAVPQIAYYVSGYCDMLASGEVSEGEAINVCVPTGNFGNILAAFYAKEMGIPIKKLICASNKNNVLTDFFKTGKYDKQREFHMTASPAMDILVSSNLERLLFHMAENDAATIRKYMAKLSETGAYTVNADIKAKLDELFFADYCDDDETMATISKVFSEHKYLVDTHTAVAIGVYEKYKNESGDETKTLIASTASPFKFSDSVLSALGIDVDFNGVELLDILSKTTQNSVPEPLAALKDLAERFTGAVERENIAETVFSFLG